MPNPSRETAGDGIALAQEARRISGAKTWRRNFPAIGCS
jgi:hypothetical protein